MGRLTWQQLQAVPLTPPSCPWLDALIHLCLPWPPRPQLDSKLLLLCQGFYKDLKAGQEELKVPRRIHDMAEDYRKEVRLAAAASSTCSHVA